MSPSDERQTRSLYIFVQGLRRKEVIYFDNTRRKLRYRRSSTSTFGGLANVQGADISGQALYVTYEYLVFLPSWWSSRQKCTIFQHACVYVTALFSMDIKITAFICYHRSAYWEHPRNKPPEIVFRCDRSGDLLPRGSDVLERGGKREVIVFKHVKRVGSLL